MSKPIAKTKEQIWNERFEKRMDELKLTQRKFSALYKERFGTGSQADVSKWMHVGEIDSRTNKGRRFPEFETMRNIAEILGVSVGYLIGETDFETFEMERASRYLGLSSPAIEAIRSITSGKAIPPFHKYPDPTITSALELFLTRPKVVEYLKNICELAQAINGSQKPYDAFESAAERIPEPYREAAIDLWADAEAAVEKGIEPNDLLWAYVSTLDDAASYEMAQPDLSDRQIKSAKYAIQEAHVKLVDDLTSEDNIPKLLPHYATREELEQLLGKAVKVRE